MKHNRIQVFEHDKLTVGKEYSYVVKNKDGSTTEKYFSFSQEHFKALAIYYTKNEGCPFYTPLYNSIRFKQFVGVIQVGDLTIEVLPKTDKHTSDKLLWQSILLNMLKISLQVEAKTTSIASVNTNKLSVLEVYLDMFLDEVIMLKHQGLVKKYRVTTGNQTSLKGRLLIQKNISQNIVHAERFYVAHNIYNHNNVYNSILKQALARITSLPINSSINSKCQNILLDYPDCDKVQISEKLFTRITYDRKTDRYKKAIELAKIILLNYHPDFATGKQNILAIMVDMNRLWENYIYYILRIACNKNNRQIKIAKQRRALFWEHPDNWSFRLIPDIVIEAEMNGIKKKLVLDTKWKYKKDTTIEDVRQMYAYSHYFNAPLSYLIYPEKLLAESPVEIKKGTFYKPSTLSEIDSKECGLIWVDLLTSGGLDMNIGAIILDRIFL